MDGWVTIGTELDTKSFDAQIDYVESQLQEIEDKLKQADMGFEVGDTMKLEAQYEKLTQKLSTLRQKQVDLNKTDLSNIQKSIDNVGNSTSNVIKKVAKWSLAIFGVRSAYMFVRQAASTLSQYNEKIGADLEYVRFALASSLQPIIEGLIQLVYKLLAYVNYIAQAWFGVNLFANASAKAMNKGAKSAEKMKKSLAGFDEMNIMQDTTGGASGGTTAPSIDLSQWQGEIPSWIQWIAENGNAVKGIILGIGTAIASLKLASLLKTLGLFRNLPLWQLVGGIGLIITGVGIAIKGVIDFIKDPSWDNFLTILQGISLVVAGIAVLMGGWVVALIALGVAIVTYVIKNWDKVKEILGKVGGWIYNNIIKPVGDFFVGLWDGIVSGVKGAVQWVKDAFWGIVDFFSNIISKIVSLFRTIGTKVGDAIGGAFKTVVNGVLKAIENILNFPIKSINKLIKTINKVPGINLGTLPTFSLPRLAVGGIVNMPGRGVPVGGAITGEAGREGVIPLTDSQAMETLGATIGKYININLTNITKLDNRQIAKEQKKINAQSDFAFNR